jgi:hypothetical protein
VGRGEGRGANLGSLGGWGRGDLLVCGRGSRLFGSGLGGWLGGVRRGLLLLFG